MNKTTVLKVHPGRPDGKVIAYASAGVRYGRLIAFPTETVYGIAANRLDRRALAELSKIKRRPAGKAYTVHIDSPAYITKMGCRITPAAKRLIRSFWPGPLTIILKSGSGAKIGFRMPANKIALDLIRKAEVPIVAPSANVSGNKPPTSAADVLRELDGKLDMVIDGGRTKLGVESTVVDLAVDPPKVLREGAIPSKKIFKVLVFRK